MEEMVRAPTEANFRTTESIADSQLNSPGATKSRDHFGSFIGHKKQLHDEGGDLLSKTNGVEVESIDGDDTDDIDYNWGKIHVIEVLEGEEPEMTVSPLLIKAALKSASQECNIDSEKVHITRSIETSKLLVEATLLAGCYQLDATFKLEKFHASTFDPLAPVAPEIFPIGHTRTFTGCQIIQTSKTSLERIFKDTGGRPKVLTCGVYTKQDNPRPPLQLTAVGIYSSKQEVFVSITIGTMKGHEQDAGIFGQHKIVIFTSDNGLPILEKTFIVVPYSYGVPQKRSASEPLASDTILDEEEPAHRQEVNPIVPCAYYSHSGVVFYR